MVLNKILLHIYSLALNILIQFLFFHIPGNLLIMADYLTKKKNYHLMNYEDSHHFKSSNFLFACCLILLVSSCQSPEELDELHSNSVIKTDYM